jgi:DNA-binding MarR family transcriptional regulator
VSRGAQSVKQSYITKLVKGMVNAGLAVRRVEMDQATGKVVVYTGPDDKTAKPADANEWDNLK